MESFFITMGNKLAWLYQGISSYHTRIFHLKSLAFFRLLSLHWPSKFRYYSEHFSNKSFMEQCKKLGRSTTTNQIYDEPWPTLRLKLCFNPIGSSTYSQQVIITLQPWSTNSGCEMTLKCTLHLYGSIIPVAWTLRSVYLWSLLSQRSVHLSNLRWPFPNYTALLDNKSLTTTLSFGWAPRLGSRDLEKGC